MLPFFPGGGEGFSNIVIFLFNCVKHNTLTGTYLNSLYCKHQELTFDIQGLPHTLKENCDKLAVFFFLLDLCDDYKMHKILRKTLKNTQSMLFIIK